MNKIRIYTCHHKASQFLSSKYIYPIHVGKANSLNDIGCRGDDSGDNISYKNPFYCELTAHYWVWKNEPTSEYVGFMHYRRHLNFSEKQDYIEDIWGVVNSPMINEAYKTQFGLTNNSIENCVEGFDIILPKKWSVLAAGSKNNLDHYENGEFLHINDYMTALKVVEELYPDYKEAIQEFNLATEGYYTNIYVMKASVFNSYSEWLFSILELVEERIAMSNYKEQEQRVIGHIAERLFNIYLINYLKNNKVKIKELQRTFVTKENYNGKLSPVFSSGIPIVISFDNNYALSGGALLNSIVKHSDASKNYDVIVLEDNVEILNKKRLLNIITGKKNFSLRFFDINVFSEINNVHTRAHFSASTYARLFIPQLLRDYDKVIFIDSDTVVKADVSQLLDVEIGSNLVAAVKDIVMEGFVQFGTMSNSDDGVMPAGEYLRKTLCMENPGEYFQAGLIVFNINQMIKENTFSDLMFTLKTKKYWFLDQDIMNKVFYGKVYFLPLEWNVYHGNGNTKDFFPNLKFSTYMAFLKARMNPKMIHYAGEKKPWKSARVDFYDDFIENIKNTPWESDVYNNTHETLNSQKTLMTYILRTKAIGKKFSRWCLNQIAPVGSPRRNIIKKYYYKLKK